MEVKHKLRIINTRPAGQAGALSGLMREAGFEPVEVPLIVIIPLQDADISSLDPEKYNGLFFSSINGLRIFLNNLKSRAGSGWLHKSVYTFSSKVAGKWKEEGGTEGFCSQSGSLQGFLEEFTLPDGDAGPVWLHPCSLMTRLKEQEFRGAGITVHNFPVYTPSLPDRTGEVLEEKLPGAAGVLFTSGSAVDNFFNCLACLRNRSTNRHIQGKAFFSLGPSASEALKRHGVHGFHQAQVPENKSLVAAVSDYFQR
jgi:uroporphyrinogen-III synthase